MNEIKDGELITTAQVGALHGEAMPRILALSTAALVGRTCTAVGYVKFDDEVYPCLCFDGGVTVICQRDDECNGPGSLAIHDKDGDLIETMCETSPSR